jgi:hypothetical protein
MRHVLLVLSLLIGGPALSQSLHVTIKTQSQKRPGYWEAAASYPRFGGGSPLAIFANSSLDRIAKEDVARFVKEIKTDYESEGKPPNPYAFDTKPTISVANKSLISLYFQAYQDLGGAHPAYWFETFSCAMMAGKPKVLHLQDLFKSGEKAIEIVSPLVIAKLKEMEASEVVNGTIKELDDNQANRFVVTQSGITFLFPPYDVASYAEGNLIVKVSFAELKGKVAQWVIKAAKQ